MRVHEGLPVRPLPMMEPIPPTRPVPEITEIPADQRTRTEVNRILDDLMGVDNR